MDGGAKCLEFGGRELVLNDHDSWESRGESYKERERRGKKQSWIASLLVRPLDRLLG